MSLSTRAFSTAARRLAVTYGGGITPEDVGKRSGEGYQKAVEKLSEQMEKDDPRIVEAKIQGDQAHQSSTDPEDKENVITVGYHTEKGTRVRSGHAHEDGTFKWWPSRAGKKK